MVWALALPIHAAEPGPSTLADASLEELLQMEVTSVSKKKQSISKAAAAVHVVSQEDIRRSGANSIPDLLRLVPGVFVGRINSSQWAISARGMADRFSNKMLVLVDGRTIYNTLYSGVYWDHFDLPVEDIDRIEVIRGPGGTMWGANAVNGVINIITKPARRTQGSLVSAGGGIEDRGFGMIRQGGAYRDNLHYRGYARYFDRGALRLPDGASARDSWNTLRSGARADWDLNERDSLSIQGDLFRADSKQFLAPNAQYQAAFLSGPDEVASSGGFGMARWERTLSETSGIAVQGYLQLEGRAEALGRSRNRVADFEFQHRTGLGSRHEVLWGAGYRQVRDRFTGGRLLPRPPVNPASRRDSLYSAFAQDDIVLVPDRFTITLGAKFQHNDYSGWEIQPAVRALWTPTRRQTIWGAVSRAVRTPARRDHHLRLEYLLGDGAPAGAIGLVEGNPAVSSEAVLSYEAGWRWQPHRRFALDAAGYYSRYRDLIATEIGRLRIETAPVRRLVLPFRFVNGMDARTWGGEVVTTVEISKLWRLHTAYSKFSIARTMHLAPGSFLRGYEPGFPRHQGQIRSSWDLTRRVELDALAFAVSSVPEVGVPGYVRGDLRLGIHTGESSEISIGARNVLGGQHREYISRDYVRAAESQPSVYMKLTWGR